MFYQFRSFLCKTAYEYALKCNQVPSELFWICQKMIDCKDIFFLLTHTVFCAMCNYCYQNELETFLKCIFECWNINCIFLPIDIRFRSDKRMIISLLVHKIYDVCILRYLLSNRLFSVFLRYIETEKCSMPMIL